MLRSISFVVAAAAILPAGVHAAEPLVLQPSTKWNVDYAPDQCSLRRAFGTGDERVSIALEQFQPGDPFSLLVVGKPLDSLSAERTRYRFEPNGGSWDRVSMTGEVAKTPAFIYSSATLDVRPDPVIEGRGGTSSSSSRPSDVLPGDPDVFGYRMSPDREAQIDALVLGNSEKRSVRLELGSMGKPMAALRACVDELVGHWGIDVDAHRTLSRSAVPAKSPASWIGAGQYPLQLLRNAEQGLVHFRLIVEPDGKPSACHIQSTTRAKGFDDAVCAAMMKNARFEPALDAAGKPIRTYWSNSVRFELP